MQRNWTEMKESPRHNFVWLWSWDVVEDQKHLNYICSKFHLLSNFKFRGNKRSFQSRGKYKVENARWKFEKYVSKKVLATLCKIHTLKVLASVKIILFQITFVAKPRLYFSFAKKCRRACNIFFLVHIICFIISRQ